jgi:hypothetical protein
MKLFRPTTFNVIFLVPVAVAMSQNGGGCATTPEARPGPLTAQQVEQTIAGNTMKAADEEAYAYVAKDGTLKGLNIPNGATSGQWRVSDNGVLCAEWDTPQGGVENCDQLSFFSKDIGYQWGGNTLLVLEGNLKNL